MTSALHVEGPARVATGGSNAYILVHQARLPNTAIPQNNNLSTDTLSAPAFFSLSVEAVSIP